MIATQDKEEVQLKKLHIKESFIHGKGVFASEFISKGSLIGIFSGKIYREEEINLYEGIKNFSFPISESLYIGPKELYNVNPIFYLNHSCSPNAGIDGDIKIVALKDINVGEEITIDYATIFFNENHFICNCGSKNCRKSIHGTDILIPELQKRYNQYIASWLQKKIDIKPETIASKLDFEERGAWGLVTALDLHDCDPQIIRDRDAIYEFTIQLCDKIKVKRFGEPIIVHFGEDERVAGYSLVQLIETSLISGHFANLTNRVYLDIFSCAYYNPSEVIEFSKNFYKANNYNCKIYLRQ
ncbi:MAG: S-adenosylmethionine decarboxylase [Leptonema sp. (in: bacteria)]